MNKTENYNVAMEAGYPVSKGMDAQTLEFCANIARRKMRPWLKPSTETEYVAGSYRCLS